MFNIYVTSPVKQSGKTFISSGLASTMQSLGYLTSVYKPIQTGCISKNGFVQSVDLAKIKSIDPYIDTHFSYLFKTTGEPLIASEAENEPVDLDLINSEYQRIISLSDCTIVDGESGLLSPIAPNIQTVDLIKKMQIPVVFVVKPDINAVNDILSSIFIAQDKRIVVRGVIINNDKNLMNSETELSRIIEEYTSVKIIGNVPALDENCPPEDLINAILNDIDIEKVFAVKIEKLGS